MKTLKEEKTKAKLKKEISKRKAELGIQSKIRPKNKNSPSRSIDSDFSDEEIVGDVQIVDPDESIENLRKQKERERKRKGQMALINLDFDEEERDRQ